MRSLLLGGCSLLLVAGCGASPDVPDAAAAAPTSAPVVEQAEPDRCESPLGFSVVAPDGWSTNGGDVLPACSWFDPDPISVPEATEARAAITLRVEDGIDAAQAWPDEQQRAEVEVAGRSAVRIEQLTGPGFYPAGTPITTYLLPLDDGRALLADAVGLPGRDHAADVEALDDMMRTLELDGSDRV